MGRLMWNYLGIFIQTKTNVGRISEGETRALTEAADSHKLQICIFLHLFSTKVLL